MILRPIPGAGEILSSSSPALSACWHSLGLLVLNSLARSLRIFICLLILCSLTGCLRRLGLNHSSLTPRTAQIDRSRDVFRSQDADSSSAPSLSPPSDDESSPSVEAEGPGSIIAPAKPKTAASLASENSGISQTGHTLQLTADKLRDIMNSRSRNAMSEGEVLKDLRPRWKVLSRNEDRGNDRLHPESVGQSERLVTVGHAATPRVAALPDDSERLGAVTSEESTEQDAAMEGTADRSVLDRLRGINETIGDTRNRWRIPSPWDVFRERETADASPGLADQGGVGTETAASVPDITENDLLKQLIGQASIQLQQWPRDADDQPVNRPAMLRLQQDIKLLNLIANSPENALLELGNSSPEEEQFWRELVLALAIYRRANGTTDAQQMSNTIDQLRSAIRELVPSSSLRIRRMDLCSEIHGFGRIETFASNSFVASDPILLYVELENFSSRTNETGAWETQFDAELKFLDADGEVIETREVPDISDESSSERADSYLSFELNIPSHLQRGDYRIELRLQDRQTGRTAAGDVRFRIR